jgi:hypothetical protein
MAEDDEGATLADPLARVSVCSTVTDTVHPLRWTWWAFVRTTNCSRR